MEKEMAIQWSIVLALGILLSGLVIHLRQNDLFRLMGTPVFSIFFDKSTNEIKAGTEFYRKMEEQLQHAKLQTANCDFGECSENLLNAGQSVKILNDFIDQTNVKDITYKNELDKTKVSFVLNTAPPIEVTYFLTNNHPYYIIDSITGIDEIFILLSNGTITKN